MGRNGPVEWERMASGMGRNEPVEWEGMNQWNGKEWDNGMGRNVDGRRRGAFIWRDKRGMNENI